MEEARIRKVSIHALVRVRPIEEIASCSNIYCFNPRTRESATYVTVSLMLDVLVSIHALVRVRLSVMVVSTDSGMFQSTHS